MIFVCGYFFYFFWVLDIIFEGFVVKVNRKKNFDEYLIVKFIEKNVIKIDINYFYIVVGLFELLGIL